jgi:Asp-tRNA(Asn)/Glu-tRNA(Gln) amidotransferase A subunit family amidase
VRAKGARVRSERDAKEYPWLKTIDKEAEILNMDVSQLRQGLISGKFTSVDLVHVYARRCVEIGRKLCLSTEENFEEALELAAVRDLERARAI